MSELVYLKPNKEMYSCLVPPLLERIIQAVTQQVQPIGRYHNPTWTAYEKAITELEGGVATIAFSSGMAAIAAVFGTMLKAGARLVMPSDAYYTARMLASGFFQTIGVEVQLAPTAGNGQKTAWKGQNYSGWKRQATLIWMFAILHFWLKPRTPQAHSL